MTPLGNWTLTQGPHAEASGPSPRGSHRATVLSREDEASIRPPGRHRTSVTCAVWYSSTATVRFLREATENRRTCTGGVKGEGEGGFKELQRTDTPSQAVGDR